MALTVEHAPPCKIFVKSPQVVFVVSEGESWAVAPNGTVVAQGHFRDGDATEDRVVAIPLSNILWIDMDSDDTSPST